MCSWLATRRVFENEDKTEEDVDEKKTVQNKNQYFHSTLNKLDTYVTVVVLQQIEDAIKRCIKHGQREDGAVRLCTKKSITDELKRVFGTDGLTRI